MERKRENRKGNLNNGQNLMKNITYLRSRADSKQDKCKQNTKQDKSKINQTCRCDMYDNNSIKTRKCLVNGILLLQGSYILCEMV